MFSTLSLVDDDGFGPSCSGCNNIIDEGSVIAFGDALFHLDCFTCAKCRRPADCESNLLLLSDGRPVCESCSYNCYVCKQVIRDEAIMTGDEAYHANCFRCTSCKRRIEDLVFTQTTKGIYCTPCHEKRKLERQKRKEEKELRKKQQQQQQYNLAYATKSLPSIPSGYHQSSTSTSSPTSNSTNNPSPPLPTPRPGALNERPYMANRHASRLFDADMVSNYMENEHKNPPTPARSRSSSMDNVSSQKRNSTILQQHYLQPTPSRSTGLSSPPNSGKRLSVIPDHQEPPMPSLPTRTSSDSNHSSQGSPSPPPRPPRPPMMLNNTGLSSSASCSTAASSSTKTLDMALPDIPSLNFSYFDNDSAELLNLTKDLGVFDAKSTTIFGNNEKLKQEAARIVKEDQDKTNSSSVRIAQASRVLSTSLMDAFPEPPTYNNQLQLASSSPTGDELPDNVAQLKSQLQLSKRKLADTEANFQKIKDASKRALDEFQNAKEEFAKENTIRQQHEKTIQQLQQQISLMLQAQQNDPRSFILKAKNDIERLANVRVELERTCEELKQYRNVLANENITVYEQQQAGLAMINTDMDSRKVEREALANETRELSKLRDDVINEMIMLNTKNAELTNMNNDLSRRVTEREREAAAVMAGTNFIRRGSEEQSTAKIVARDSFQGTQAPKVFKIKPKNFFKKSNSTDNWPSPSSSTTASAAANAGMLMTSSSTLTLVNSNNNNTNNGGTRRHAFHAVSFLRPTKCDVCNDKVWGRSDLRCQGCGFITHAKCLSHAPQACSGEHQSRSNSLDDIGNTGLFGLDLSEQVAKEDRSVPRVVEQCIDAVEARGMDYEGIYRKSGGAAQMRTIQRAFERDLPLDLDDDEEFNDICAITSVLKHYFRKLPNPLLTFELYSKWIEVGTMEPGQSKQDAVIGILDQLPKANYDTLKMLAHHLYRVRQQSSENLMTTKNLAVVFAPTLMRDQDGARDLLDMSYKNATLEYLINQAMELFP
ncbi:hypothetical protein BDA99DRAFT_558939 [Phascolomyces articulosus]|uniref:RhoGAP-domain-containing protein n=1 Tax=Phascolomyces articulosus TaxID=60185 RepID=A0AAD5KDA5_9FUNG|nr:hypothetical protein BDA99DRAFT_558939 [Phascolomyces articulosus]